MLDYIENITQAPEASNGRSRAKRILKDGRFIKGLLEWTPAPPEVFLHYLEAIEERIPTSGGRAEEVHTMKINGLFRQGSRTAIFYECEESPIDLREVLLKIPKPPDYVIRALARVIATQIRSLHVHFQIDHTSLRTESFVFQRGKPVDYTRPYLLDMARSPVPEIYRHPEYRPDGELAWFYQVWALMMILSEIAEWKPLDLTKPGEESGVELLRRKLSRRRQVTSAEWQSGLPTQVFRLGFGFLDADRETLETYNRWRVKKFYDELCELLAPDES
ncbi:hypothetical protein FHL15_009198 [Xylaria flabelliformis]|uniref:Protein kinase domain-containing protein n=1 Tax=Xylaria flabelliformis TaxID=2512241 RepID=A0A553HPP2_9PEZI|nr:hypothetical protein FHL15_009198 [Xylaria flabelliformis]